MDCPKCGRTNVEAHPTDTHLCVDCVHAENNRLTYYRQHQDDWLTVAKESGLDAWVQQPGETQWEYTVWCAYRDSYPGKRPSYSDTAKQLGTTYNVVKKIAQRWTFPIRMQLWMRHVDVLTLAQRKQEVIEMNKSQVEMAKIANAKLMQAIQSMDPTTMKPSEIASFIKVTAELERKARLDLEAQEELQRHVFVDPEIKQQKKQEKPEDLAEIVKILAAAGALEGLKMKQTTTTTTEVTVDNAIDAEAIEVEDEDDE